MLNKFADYHLYLAAAHNPSKEVAENSEIKSTEADAKLNAPYLQLLQTIDSMETRMNQKIEDLRLKGVQGVIEEKLEKTMSAPQPEPSNISYPDDKQPVAESVISTTELKVKPRKRPKKEILPIMVHESHGKMKKVKKCKKL